MRQMSDPENPDMVARKAGQDLYGSKVGALRRSELWRLGNAWGAKFPEGATKDFMLPFFQQLEAEGKNPMRPPGGSPLETVIRAREVEHSGPSHAELAPEDEKLITELEPPKSEFQTKLEALPFWKVRNFAHRRAIPQKPKDTKIMLIARIMSYVKEKNLEGVDPAVGS